MAKLTPQIIETIKELDSGLAGSLTSRALLISSKVGISRKVITSVIRDTPPESIKLMNDCERSKIVELYDSMEGNESDYSKFKKIMEKTGWSISSITNTVKNQQKITYFNPKMEQF